jgi:hypothetical protein
MVTGMAAATPSSRIFTATDLPGTGLADAGVADTGVAAEAIARPG